MKFIRRLYKTKNGIGLFTDEILHVVSVVAQGQCPDNILNLAFIMNYYMAQMVPIFKVLSM
jgi:hypothetical protein